MIKTERLETEKNRKKKKKNYYFIHILYIISKYKYMERKHI